MDTTTSNTSKCDVCGEGNVSRQVIVKDFFGNVDKIIFCCKQCVEELNFKALEG